jgi:hypothetical protein
MSCSMAGGPPNAVFALIVHFCCTQNEAGVNFPATIAIPSNRGCRKAGVETPMRYAPDKSEDARLLLVLGQLSNDFRYDLRLEAVHDTLHYSRNRRFIERNRTGFGGVIGRAEHGRTS